VTAKTTGSAHFTGWTKALVMRGAMPTVPCCSGLTEIVNRVDGAVEPTRSQCQASEVELPTIDAQDNPSAAGLALLRRAHAEASRDPEELTRLH
jgi:hypothetical protein